MTPPPHNHTAKVVKLVFKVGQFDFRVLENHPAGLVLVSPWLLSAVRKPALASNCCNLKVSKKIMRGTYVYPQGKNDFEECQCVVII